MDAWERRRERVSREIEAIAVDLFAQKGYYEVPVEDIAEASGVSVRTFFRYFRTKEDVLLALPRRTTDRLIETLSVRPPEEPVLESVRQAALPMELTLTENLDMTLRLSRVINTDPHLFARMLSDEYITDTLLSVIADRLGEDPATDLRPVLFCHVIQGAVRGALVRWLAANGAVRFDVLIDEAVSIVGTLKVGKSPTGARVRTLAPST